MKSKNSNYYSNKKFGDNTMKELTKEELKQRLLSDDKTLIKALVALSNCQTPEETASEATFVKNGMGFRSFDAKVGVGMVKFYKKAGFLTDKQIEYWRKKDVRGKERIVCYLNQLHTLHLSKMQQVNKTVEPQKEIKIEEYANKKESEQLKLNFGARQLGSRF